MKLPALKEFVPPLISTLYRNYRNGLLGLYIWQGVYDRFDMVPTVKEGYHGDDLARETERSTQAMLDQLKAGEGIPYSIAEENILLPLVSVMLKKGSTKLTVLDLGGGMGSGFLSLLHCGYEGEIAYHVVETPAMCAGGSRLFKDDNRIKFWDHLPDELPEVDIVFVDSALQYFEQYRETLDRLAAYKPEYFLFVKLSAGNIPTYASLQRNLGGSGSAYWFFNVQEIIGHMRAKGYGLVYKSTLGREYNQDNFPEQYRLRRTCNLLFKLTVDSRAA